MQQKAPPAWSPTPPLCTPLPAAGFAAPSPATQARPVKAASHKTAKSPVSGGKRRQQAEVVKTEPQQEEKEAQTRTQDSPPTKKHKAVKTEPGTEEEEDESQGEEKVRRRPRHGGRGRGGRRRGRASGRNGPCWDGPSVQSRLMRYTHTCPCVCAGGGVFRRPWRWRRRW